MQASDYVSLALVVLMGYLAVILTRASWRYLRVAIRWVAALLRRAQRGKLFISYRRSDSEHPTGRIYDGLQLEFGQDCVFKDVDNIPLGVDFRQHLSVAVARADLVLAVIGARWLEPSPESGRPRIWEDQDFVRAELLAALQRGKPIIPLLVAGAAMPSESQLPAELSKLAFLQAHPVRSDPDFREDMRRLIVKIRSAWPRKFRPHIDVQGPPSAA